VLAPGGTAVLHCSTSPLWTVKGAIWRLVPSRLVGIGQRLFLGYPAPMRMTALPERRVEELVRAAGGAVLASRTDRDRSTHWRLTTYVVGKPRS
jgi:hypothetical protein